jgi:hypothetical protein
MHGHEGKLGCSSCIHFCYLCSDQHLTHQFSSGAQHPAQSFIIILFKASPSDCKFFPQAVTHKRRTRGAKRTRQSAPNHPNHLHESPTMRVFAVIATLATMFAVVSASAIENKRCEPLDPCPCTPGTPGCGCCP